MGFFFVVLLWGRQGDFFSVIFSFFSLFFSLFLCVFDGSKIWCSNICLIQYMNYSLNIEEHCIWFNSYLVLSVDNQPKIMPSRMQINYACNLHRIIGIAPKSHYLLISTFHKVNFLNPARHPNAALFRSWPSGYSANLAIAANPATHSMLPSEFMSRSLPCRPKR